MTTAVRGSVRRRTSVWTLAAGYLAATLVVSWPLATRLTSSLAGDFGDSVFVMWVMAWVAQHLTALLHGDLAAWSAMWDAPIFAPETNTLAYSDHFIPQALQVLPIYWVTGNPLLAYNVASLSTFVLAGLAAHLLAWRLTGSHLAGAVTGLTFAFSDYRLSWELGHLQTLSLHWWAFALWGLEGFAATGRLGPLVFATVALVALNLSSSYLMAFSAPFSAAFSLWALARHGRLRDRRFWIALAVSGATSVACAAPILARYMAMRNSLGVSRTLGEFVGNSATLAAYGAAMPWIAPLSILAAIGAAAPSVSGGGVSRRAKLGLVGLVLAAVVLSLGPRIQIGAETITGPYAWLIDHVPGFAGLRVAHRFAAIASLFLSLLAGIGAAWMARWTTGAVAVVGLVGLTLHTALATTFPIDLVIDSTGLAPPGAYLRPAARPAGIYSFVATTPPDSLVLELPFGDIGYEIRYTYFTLQHGRRILNGYSGVLPPSYLRRQAVLRTPLADPEASWAALAPATHVVVHIGAWFDDSGTRVRQWLEQRGARVVGGADGAWLYELPALSTHASSPAEGGDAPYNGNGR